MISFVWGMSVLGHPFCTQTRYSLSTQPYRYRQAPVHAVRRCQAKGGSNCAAGQCNAVDGSSDHNLL